MTLTVISPGTGRQGPGSSFFITSDTIGPWHSLARLKVQLRLAGTTTVVMSQRQPMASVNAGIIGVGSTISGSDIGAMPVGIADGTALDLYAAVQLYPITSDSEPITVTGLYWDATSQMWFVNFQLINRVVNALNLNTDELALIKSAVIGTYGNP